MADADDIPKVIDKFHSFKPESCKKKNIWRKVTAWETLSVVKKRLSHFGDTVIGLDHPLPEVENAQIPPKTNKELPTATEAKEASSPTLTEETPQTDPKEEAVTSEEEKDDVAAIVNEDVQETPQPSKDGDNASAVVVEEPREEQTSNPEKKESSDSSSSPALPKDQELDVPRLNEDMFKILSAAVREHRRNKPQSSDSEQEERKSQNSEDSTTTDRISSNDFPFENLADFVTVDEISVEPSDKRHHSSSASSSSRRSSDSRRDREKYSSSCERHRTSTRSSRESTNHPSSTSSSSSRSNNDHFKSPSSTSSCSSSSPKKPSESSKSQSSSSHTRYSTAHDKSLEDSKFDKYKKDKPKESDVTRSSHKGSDKSPGTKSQEKAKDHEVKAKLQQSSPVIELNKETVQELKDRNKKRKLDEEDNGESFKILDEVEAQFDEEIQKGEEGVELHKTFEVLDSVTEQDAREETPDEIVYEKGQSQETEASQSNEGSKPNLKPETRSKRKREEDDKIQEICSKTTKLDDREGTEQEAFEILDSIEDQTSTEDTPRGKNVSKEVKTLEKDDFKIIDEVEEQPQPDTDSESEKSKKGETSRSTRSGRSARSEDNEKSPKRHGRTSKKHETRTRMDEEIVEELKIVDSIEEEPTQNEDRSSRSTREKDDKEVAYEILDAVEDHSATCHEVSTRERLRSVKMDSSSDEKLQKDDAKHRKTPSQERRTEDVLPAESSKGLNASEFKILDAVEEEMAATLEKPLRTRSSKKDSREKSSQNEGTLKSPAKGSQEIKDRRDKEGSYKMLDSVEEVFLTRSTRRSRSSHRDYSSDSSHKEGTPRRGTPARESQDKTERSTTKVDVQEAIEEEFQILDAVDEEPTPTPAKRGRPRKQPQKKVLKSDERISVKHQQCKVQLSKLEESKCVQKMVQLETSTEEVTKKVEEDEDYPMYEVLDSLEEDQIQDQEMPSPAQKLAQDLVDKMDPLNAEARCSDQEKATCDETELAQKDANETHLADVGNSSVTVELEMLKEIVEPPKDPKVSVVTEQGTLLLADEQTTTEDQASQEVKSQPASKETVSEIGKQPAKREVMTTTRSTRSGRVCRSEEKPQRSDRTTKSNRESSDEVTGKLVSRKTPIEKVTKKQKMGTCETTESKKNSEMYTFDDVSDDEFQVLDSVEDEAEKAPQVKPKRGRPRKQPKKVASKTGDVKAKCPTVEVTDTKVAEKMEEMLGKSETHLEDLEPIYQVVDSLEEIQNEEMGATDKVTEETLETVDENAPKDGLSYEQEKLTTPEEMAKTVEEVEDLFQEATQEDEHEKQEKLIWETQKDDSKNVEEGKDSLEDLTTIKEAEKADVSKDEAFVETDSFIDSVDGQAVAIEADSEKREIRSQQEANMGLIDSKDEKSNKDQNEQELPHIGDENCEKVDLNFDTVSDDDFPDVEGVEGMFVLDEFIETEDDVEQEEGLKEEELEPHPQSQEDQSEEVKTEILENPVEACTEEATAMEETQEPTVSKSIKRKLEDDTDEGPNFVTVDEVGEEEKEKVTPTRGRGRKGGRKTPVRKSTRGRKVRPDEVEDDNKESEVQPSVCSEEFMQKEKDHIHVSDVQPETVSSSDQPVELGVETDIRVGSKRRSDLLGPDSKRSRSQSPSLPSDTKLPLFRPNNPLGQEFVVPKSGFFCNLCSVFYINETTAREQHCSSRRHYENLKTHFQRQSRSTSEF